MNSEHLFLVLIEFLGIVVTETPPCVMQSRNPLMEIKKELSLSIRFDEISN